MTRTGVQDTKAKCQNSLFDFVSSVQRSDVGRRLCFHRESLEENKTKPTPPPILGPPVPGFRLGPGLLTHQMCRCWSLPVGSTPHHLPSGTLLQLFFFKLLPRFSQQARSWITLSFWVQVQQFAERCFASATCVCSSTQSGPMPLCFPFSVPQEAAFLKSLMIPSAFIHFLSCFINERRKQRAFDLNYFGLCLLDVVLVTGLLCLSHL